MVAYYKKFHRRKAHYKKQKRGEFKSKFEKAVAEQLAQRGIPIRYETHYIRYVQPATERKYLIDFDLGPFYLEVKGYLEPSERKKLLYVREYADKEIRILFMNASNPIYKGSKTTYADWAEKNGFKWAEGQIPEEWFEEIKKWREENG